MKQILGPLLVGLLSLQLACAGADAENTAEGAEESAAPALELSAQDFAHAAADEEDAPESVELLSPAERDAQLGALGGLAAGTAGSRSLPALLPHVAELLPQLELLSAVSKPVVRD